MRALRLVAFLGACSTSVLVLSSASAQLNDKPRRLHLGVGVDAMDHLGDQCEQAFDVVCSPGTIFYPFTAAASFRILPWLSVGARFAVASKNTGNAALPPRHVSIWQLSLEARGYPFGHGRVAPFLGVALGYGSLLQTSAGPPERTKRDSSLFGGTAGLDFALHEWVLVSTEVRLVRMNLEASEPEQQNGRSTYYPGKAWLTFGVQLVALLPV